MEGPKFSKRQRLGKNKKKSWRGIDITPTEEFLEDQRFQLRTTGLVAEKSNEQLFEVARAGKKDLKPDEGPRTRRKVKTELNCYNNLINTSRIDCPRKEYPTAPDFESKVGYRAVRSVNANKRKVTPAKPAESAQDTGRVDDLWGEEKTAEPGVDDFHNTVTKRKRVQPPKHIQRKGSSLPAVQLPHPGSSVNPAYDDHQDLLLQAHMVEEKKDKAERRVFNALDAKFPCVSQAPTQATWMEEMSGGLFDEKRDSEDEGTNDKHISLNPPVDREKKKTPRERRKAQIAKLVQQRLLVNKETKMRDNKVFSVTRLKSELASERKEMAFKAELQAKKKEMKKFVPKKLGKTKVETPELEVKLSDELMGSLRQVKPEGHLLEERYKSMQMRNILEPRAIINRKKTKTKKFEKKSFREVTV